MQETRGFKGKQAVISACSQELDQAAPIMWNLSPNSFYFTWYSENKCNAQHGHEPDHLDILFVKWRYIIYII